MDREPGTVYLLHLDQPYQHARHYTGWAASSRSLKARLADHEKGKGARLLQVVKAAGITWTLARTWPGDRKRERQLKAQGGASRRCPQCGVNPRPAPGQRRDMTGMKQPRDRDTGRTPGTRPPEYVIETWVSEQLRDRTQRTGKSLAEALQATDTHTHTRRHMRRRQIRRLSRERGRRAGGRNVSDTVHRIVTERMIAALQRGTVPWHKPWQAAAGRPRSMSTGQPYRGVNVFLLGMTAAEEGYGSPFWGTYRQIGDLGGQVRKGERSTLVVFWKQAQIEHRDPQNGEPSIKQLPVLRYYRVFNAAQADHLPERYYPAPGEHSELAEPQAVLDGYLADGPKLVHVAGDRADYHPATDTIRIPPRAQFRSAEGYYATAFHEAGHSTGHPARLNRPGIAAFDHSGSGQYAREELAAQMTSSVLCALTGIDTPEIFDNSASYIAGWLSALNDDKRLVITAAAQAQHATDVITGPERQPAKDNEQHSRSPASRQQIRDAERVGTIPGTAPPSDYSYLGDRSRSPETAERSGDWQAEAG